MADGIRIQPAPDRFRQYGSMANRLVTVRDVTRPITPHPQNPVCRVCGMQHDCKTYHFQLDAEATVMVSTTIWENLKRLADNGGFEQMNVVNKPPAQGIILPPAVVKVRPAEF